MGRKPEGRAVRREGEREASCFQRRLYPVDRWHSQGTGDGEGMLSEQNVYKAQGPENASGTANGFACR